MNTTQQIHPFRRFMLIILALCGWFALVTQMKLNIESKAAPLPEILIRYFSYFTLLSNLIVAIACTSILLFPTSRPGMFAARYSTETAVTNYILIVGIVYNLLLRGVWTPTGMQKVLDELLHTVIPLLFLLQWIFLVKKHFLPYKALLPWLLYPLIYIIFVLTRGSVSGFYPYYFIDLNKLSISQVLLNSAGIALSVIVMSVILIFIGNKSIR